MQDFVTIQKHLTAVILFSLILRANAFSFKDAKNWGKKYSDCYGKHQSPVNLVPPDMRGFPSIDQVLKFTNFNKLPTNVTIRNTGHTVEVKAHWSGKRPTLSGGPLHKKYVFEKITFHWAEKADTNKKFTAGYEDNDNPDLPLPPYMLDMEVHIFFYRTDLKSFEKAQSHKGGLAAFQFWLQTSSDTCEHVFDNLEQNLHKVRSPKSAAEIPPSRLASILVDREPLHYDFYEGSLDYPPCHESVTWFVDGSSYATSDNLVNEFRKIKFAEEDNSNLRPPQAINDRQPMSVNGYKVKDE